MVGIIKKASILFFALLSCVCVSAAEVNAYYRVTASTLNARSRPDKNAAKVKQYNRHNVVYITNISSNGQWGFVHKDQAWVYMSYVQQLNQTELTKYLEYLKRHGITPESEIVDTSQPRGQGSKPLRILLWVFFGLLIVMSVGVLFTDEPLKSLGVLYATVALCILVLVVISYAQYVLCWGLKIVGWIDHYIMFGWLVDAFANGILAIIPFVLDLPTYGVVGLGAGLLPVVAFCGIVCLFDRDDYPFAQWVVYIFQLVVLVAVFTIDTGTWYELLNPVMELDHVSTIDSLIKACDWGEYANNVFILAFYLGTIVLLVPVSVIGEKMNYF